MVTLLLYDYYTIIARLRVILCKKYLQFVNNVV